MPIHSEHLERLNSELEVHEDRVSELRKQISVLEDEIAVHEWIIRFGRNRNLLRILGELADNPESARSMEGRELEIAAEHHIEIPPRATVSLTHDGSSVTVHLDATQWKIPFTLKWSSAEGFSSGFPSGPEVSAR